MHIELITIGDEVMEGRVVNTNAADLGRALASAGFPASRVVSIGDSQVRIAAAVREAVSRADWVILTGGLGPTHDDRTREAIAAAAELPLERRESILDTLRKRYADRGRAFLEANRKLADFPRGASAVDNPVGSAPGIVLKIRDCRLVAFPGVPEELHAMIQRWLLPRLKEAAGPGAAELTLRTFGIPESALADLMQKTESEHVRIGSYPGIDHGLDICLRGLGEGAAEAVAAAARVLRSVLGDAVYGEGTVDLADVVVKAATERGVRIAVAESCTGGWIAKRLTDAAGSSACFLGGVVAYANEVKQSILRIPEALLSEHGAVSAPVARRMARGAKEAFGADLGLGITGTAGPGGGTASKPVGLVFLAVSDNAEEWERRLELAGPRDLVRRRAAQAALDLLRRRLLGLAKE